MKPAPFRHFSPSSIHEALALLHEHAPDARALAGGQSLVPMMNFRLAQPPVLVDLNRIPALAYIRDAGDCLAIGAMTREWDIEVSDLVARHAPLLHQATLNIAHLPIRRRGTIGGSIANADPAAEYPASILAMEAELVVRSTRGERKIRAGDFFTGVMTTAIAPDELLVEIRIPKISAGTGTAFVEISRRHGDYALVGIAAQVTLDGPNVVDVRLAACGAGPNAVRLSSAETALRSHEPTDDAVRTAAAAAVRDVTPQGDLHATAAYRSRLVSVLTRRAIVQAIDQARRAA